MPLAHVSSTAAPGTSSPAIEVMSLSSTTTSARAPTASAPASSSKAWNALPAVYAWIAWRSGIRRVCLGPPTHLFDHLIEGPDAGEVESVAVDSTVQWMGVAIAESCNDRSTIEMHDLVERR